MLRTTTCLICGVFLVALCLANPAEARDTKETTTETKKEPSDADRLAQRFDKMLEQEKGLEGVIIEVRANPQSDGFKSLTIYGRGIGIWESSKQFELKEKKLRKALELFKEHGFFSLSERVEGPAPTPTSAGPASHARLMFIRSVTLTIGSKSKTSYQDNKAFESPQLRDLVHDLAEIARKPASKGIGCSDLDDGLKKVAAGTLAPETLEVTVNAPTMRSLPSQDGQGWMLRLSHGKVETNSHDLAAGWAKAKSRPLAPAETVRLAKAIKESKFSALPINLKAPGYTDCTVTVLDHHHQIQAREFARELREGEETMIRDFLEMRKAFFELWEKFAK